jgi:pimeloyl-ACP methyl ester carboxylesterase
MGTAKRSVCVLALTLGACGGAPRAGVKSTNTSKEGTVAKMQLRITGQGRPLVIVGQGLTGILSWIPHAEKLAPARRVALAQPLSVEWGRTHRPLPADYSVKMESGALAAALADAGLTEALDVVAWSYGGLIALDFALDHPERVRTLLLVEPDAAWVLPDYGRADGEVRRTEDSAKRWADGVSEDELAAFVAGMLGPGQSPREHPRWPIWNEHRDALRAIGAVFRHRDDVSRLRTFPKPVMLVKGEGTDRYNVVVGEALAAALPRARVLELPGGHMCPVVAMDRFLQEMREFQK